MNEGFNLYFVSEANYFNVSLKWHDQEINGL